jgi:hypothetical protein
MIRKPSADWGRTEEGPAVQTVRAASAVAKSASSAARRGGHAFAGLVCYFFAAIWGFAAVASGLAMGSLPSLLGIGGMAALVFMAGRRSFAKARAPVT